MDNLDVFQVYRVQKDLPNFGNTIEKDTLLQIRKIDGSLIGLIDEEKRCYWISSKELSNTEFFKRVF